MSTTELQDQHSTRSDTADDPARIQPWFATMASSLLPAVMSFYLPDAFRVPMLVATGVLYLVACVMLYTQTKRTPQGIDNR